MLVLAGGRLFSDLALPRGARGLGDNPHDGAKVVAKMKEMPTDDPLFGKGVVRLGGRKIHRAYPFEVNAPEAPLGLKRLEEFLPTA